MAIAREVGRVGLAIGAALCAATSAHAAPFLETFGAPTGPTPFSARVLVTGADATYFNPALLLDVEPGIQVGFFAVQPSLSIDLDPRPPGTDVSSKIYGARRLNPDGTTSRLERRPLPTAALRHARGSLDPSATNLFLTIGTVVPLLEERIALGMHVVLPTRSFQTQRVAFSDERERYFSNSLRYELYGDRFEASLISLALASRPFDELSLGVGMTAATEARANNEVFVPDASDQSVTAVNTSVEVHTRFCPYAGIDVVPIDPLHVVATLHYPYSNDTVGQNDVQLWNYEYPAGQSSFPQSFHLRSQATPLRAALGVGWRPEKQRGLGWTAGGTVVWTRWSAYRDRHGEHPADPWLDTLTASAGGSLVWGTQRLGLDATFAPSPVPEQTGRSSYVDNDRAAAAVGYAIRWKLAGRSFEAGAQLQTHRLLPRSTRKSSSAAHPVIDEFPDSVDATTGEPIPEAAGLQTNNPGYPGLPCAIEIDNGTPVIKTIIPDVFLSSLGSSDRTGNLVFSAGQWRFVQDSELQLRGVKLDHPETDALPTDASDPRVWDQDQDGKPGVTVRVTGLTDGEVYVVQRDIHALDGVVQGDFIDGMTDWSNEQVVLGSDNPILNVQTVSAKNPDAKASYFRTTRGPSGMDCAMIIAQRDQLFAR